MSEQVEVTHELQLIAPSVAPPGADMPARTVLLNGIGSMEGAQIASGPVTLRLHRLDGTPVASTQLDASIVGGAEGLLRLPREPGRYVLRAIALEDGHAVASVQQPIDVRAEDGGQPLVGRPATELQEIRLSPVELLTNELPPIPFDARVVGGACVPESICTILVHVGSAPASVRIVESESHASDVPTSGIVALEYVVHGPEASITLEARRRGVAIAHRTLRLPVALATPELQVAYDDDGAASLTVSVLGERPGFIVDAFVGDKWVNTATVARTTEPFALPFDLTDASVTRLQVRTDPFYSERAATRFVALGDLDRALAEVVGIADEGEPPPGSPSVRLGWSASRLERSIRTTPVPVSGYNADVERIEERKGQLRIAALVGMGLGMLVLLLVFFRRGVDAAMIAQGVMDQTGDPELSSARHRRKTLLSALAIVATVLLAFVGAAALIIVRARMFS